MFLVLLYIAIIHKYQQNPFYVCEDSTSCITESVKYTSLSRISSQNIASFVLIDCFKMPLTLVLLDIWDRMVDALWSASIRSRTVLWKIISTRSMSLIWAAMVPTTTATTSIRSGCRRSSDASVRELRCTSRWTKITWAWTSSLRMWDAPGNRWASATRSPVAVAYSCQATWK